MGMYISLGAIPPALQHCIPLLHISLPSLLQKFNMFTQRKQSHCASLKSPSVMLLCRHTMISSSWCLQCPRCPRCWASGAGHWWYLRYIWCTVYYSLRLKTHKILCDVERQCTSYCSTYNVIIILCDKQRKHSDGRKLHQLALKKNNKNTLCMWQIYGSLC